MKASIVPFYHQNRFSFDQDLLQFYCQFYLLLCRTISLSIQSFSAVVDDRGEVKTPQKLKTTKEHFKSTLRDTDIPTKKWEDPFFTRGGQIVRLCVKIFRVFNCNC